jgi:hypothetical protein
MADKIKIFRVHHPESGEGPYGNCTGVLSDYWEGEKPWDTDGYHPSPWNDPKLKADWSTLDWFGKTDKFFFGFSDMDQFLLWFHKPEWLEQLKRLGYVLTIWEVAPENAYIGEFQAIFYMDHAEWVDTQDLI